MHNMLVHFCVYRCTPSYMHVCMLASVDAKGHLNTELCMYIVQTVQTTWISVPLDHSTFWTWSVSCVWHVWSIASCAVQAQWKLPVCLLLARLFGLSGPLHRHCQSWSSWATQAARESVECSHHSPPLLPTEGLLHLLHSKWTDGSQRWR